MKFQLKLRVYTAGILQGHLEINKVVGVRLEKLHV